jgi:threonine dehydrogenase-like Zn-dependent dehydrogenase
MTGVVEAVGESVTDFTPGDRVSAWRDQGHNRQGCYAQYVVHEQDSLLKVPPELDPPALAPLELAMCLSVSILDLKAMNAIEGRDYAVSGLGPAGLVALQLLKAEGATTVVGLDPNPSRCEYAVMVGADRAIDPTGEAGQAIPERPFAGCFECAIDCVGYWDSVRYVMDHTREFVALFGVQREDYVFGAKQARGPGLKLCGYRGHYKEAAEYALAKIREGALDLSPLVTHKLPLEDYDHAVHLLKSQEAAKVCFLPWE